MLDTLTRPEYTGANRCYPCTAVNLAIVVLLGSITAVVSPIGALVVVVGGLLAVWLRGYVVPLTPRFGPWLKHRLREWFGPPMSDKSDGEPLGGSDISGETVLEKLTETDVLTTLNGELRLSSEFADAWDDEIRKARALEFDTELETWARTVLRDTEISHIEAVDPHLFDPYLVFSLESDRETTMMYPVAVAEVAAVATLENTGLRESVRLRAAGPLRGFLDSCPTCDEALVWSQSDGCCGNPRPDETRPSLVCPACGTVTYKQPPQ